MSKSCKCAICKTGEAIQALVTKYNMSKEDSWLLLDTFWSRLEDAETERDYLRSILDGDWSHSKERLKYALEKAEAKSG